MIEELSSQTTDVKDLGSEDEVMWDNWLSEVVVGTQDNPRQLEVLKRLRCIKDTLLVIVEPDAVSSYGIGYTPFQHTVRALVLVSRRKFASLGFR